MMPCIESGAIMSEDYLALFRPNTRLQYLKQNIKLLRAVEGEITHARYRWEWLTDESVEQLTEHASYPLAVACFVDLGWSQARPVRLLEIVDAAPDDDAMSFSMKIGPFLSTSDAFSENFRDWPGTENLTPPEKFVVPWRSDWPEFDMAELDQQRSSWKQAIDFLTRHDECKQTVFLRLADEPEIVADGGVTLSAVAGESKQIALDSYNRHLDDESLAMLRMKVLGDGAYGESVAPDSIPADGPLSIQATWFESGEAFLDLRVEPGWSSSTFLPLRFTVAPGSTPPQKKMFLGRDWEYFLDRLCNDMFDDLEGLTSLLEKLSQVFPSDTRLAVKRGKIFYDAGNYAGALQLLDPARTKSPDDDATAYSIFARLMSGRPAEKSLLEEFNSSNEVLFDELLSVIAESPSIDLERLLSDIHDLFPLERELRILHRLVDRSGDEDQLVAVMDRLSAIEFERAFRYLEKYLGENPDATRARGLLLDIYDAHKKELAGFTNIERFVHPALAWSGDEPGSYISRFEQFSPLLPVRERIRVMTENAERMVDAGQLLVGVDLSLRAAESALGIGDLMVARAIALGVLVHEDELTQTSHYLDRAKAVLAQVEAIESDHGPILSYGEEAWLLNELRPFLEGQRLVVVGYTKPNFDFESWVAPTGLKDTPRWFSPEEKAAIKKLSRENLIVAETTERTAHFHLKEWANAGGARYIEVAGLAQGILSEMLEWFKKEREREASKGR